MACEMTIVLGGLYPPVLCWGRLAFTGLEVFLGPPFQAGFLFGTIDSAFFQDFELGRHYFL